ncbi:MAG: DUF4492 domain-containing protein [Barnesiella sp.]|jgi:hypothetical protein|uniref:DUF4492 domain-containing protein n=1 Tax=Barnesiella propionica TaxID=2981781 RepID=UPI0026C7700C
MNKEVKMMTVPSENIFVRIYRFYAEGFRNMTLGKTLWAIIFIKLFIMFFILRLFFFPNFLNSRYDSDEAKASYVMEQLTAPVSETQNE